MKIKPGDKVVLKPQIVALVYDDGDFSIQGLSGLPTFSADNVERVLPRSFKAGDRVVTANRSKGVLLAVHDDYGWVLADKGISPVTWFLYLLRHDSA